MLSIVAGRADILHFVYLEPLLVLVLAWGMDGRDIPGDLFRSIRVPLMACVTGAFLALGLPLLLRAVQTPVHVETRRGTVEAPAEDTVIPYVEAHLAPGDEMLSYPYLPLYNYLTGTIGPTRFDYFQQGMHTKDQAGEMIAELASRRTGTVLLETGFAEKIVHAWPETPLGAIANDPVAGYILSHYRTCRVLRSPSDWRFAYMVLKDVACPDK